MSCWVVLGGAARATHTPDITDDESKCQIKASLSVSKFANKKAKCIDGCQKKARKNPSVLPDCSPPFGGSTFGCVTSAEGKWSGKITSSCARDCPECYSGGDCQANGDAKIARPPSIPTYPNNISANGSIEYERSFS